MQELTGSPVAVLQMRHSTAGHRWRMRCWYIVRSLGWVRCHRAETGGEQGTGEEEDPEQTQSI